MTGKRHPNIDDMHWCGGCAVYLDFLQFGLDKSQSDGMNVACKECCRKRARITAANNPYSDRAHSANTAAKTNNAPGKLTAQDWQRAVIRADGLCTYCDSEVEEVAYSLDHVIPLHEYLKGNLLATNTLSNIAAVCLPCNHAKNGGSLEAHVAYLNRIKAGRGNLIMVSCIWRKLD